jgi:hypothetical protein
MMLALFCVVLFYDFCSLSNHNSLTKRHKKTAVQFCKSLFARKLPWHRITLCHTHNDGVNRTQRCNCWQICVFGRYQDRILPYSRSPWHFPTKSSFTFEFCFPRFYRMLYLQKQHELITNLRVFIWNKKKLYKKTALLFSVRREWVFERCNKSLDSRKSSLLSTLLSLPLFLLLSITAGSLPHFHAGNERLYEAWAMKKMFSLIINICVVSESVQSVWCSVCNN